ncbi:MAG: hypothetical protein ACT4RN_10885 [Pseudonocardia sp.]
MVDAREPRPAHGRGWSRAAGPLLEVVVAVTAAVVSVVLAGGIAVDPVDPIGRVSGLAALDLRFVVLGLAVLGVCLAAVHAPNRRWRLVTRGACATLAGLTTGLVAGGVVVALQGTVWPLNAVSGDSGQLIRWVTDLMAGRPLPPAYPPLVIEVTAAVASLTGDPVHTALRHVQVIGTALFGPIAYLAWRLLLAPGWALAVTLVAALPLLEPYKPYTTVVLVVLVPLLIGLLGAVRRAATATWLRVLVTGGSYGVALGVLFVVYSGWFVWSAPGAVLAALALLPRRAGAVRGLVLLLVAFAALTAVSATHLFDLLGSAGAVRDDYFYFDTFVDPAYVAMWRNDLPGDVGAWPPPGELAGVGLFSVLLAVGLGVAVAVAGRSTAVVTLCLLLAGAWVIRLSIAAQMYDAQSVQLYPRTTAEILFCLLVLAVLAVQGVTQRAAPLLRQAAGGPARWASHRSVTVGGLAAALLLGLFAGSATADRYMPRNDGSAGQLAYVAQFVRQPDGRCSVHSAPACVRDTARLPGVGLDVDVPESGPGREAFERRPPGAAPAVPSVTPPAATPSRTPRATPGSAPRSTRPTPSGSARPTTAERVPGQ